MNTGSIVGGRPSLGAWVTYGLGTENENLPAFVVMQTMRPVSTTARALGHRLHARGLSRHAINPTSDPINHLNPPVSISPDQQRADSIS